MDICKKARMKVRREFYRFKQQQLLLHSRQEIFESCGKIHFYTSLSEYFELNEKIPEVYLELALRQPQIIRVSWNCYLEREELSYQTWGQIEALLEVVLLDWRIPHAA